MAAGGFTVDVDSLDSLAKYLSEIALSLPGAVRQQQVVTPKFGQGGVFFEEAANLASLYSEHTTMVMEGVSAFSESVSVLARAAEILAKRYRTFDEAGAADANTIKQALTQAAKEVGSARPAAGAAFPSGR
jgi:hypothetical protein